MNFNQSNYKPEVYKDTEGNDYQYQPPNGTYVFDFYKSGEKYVPSKISIKSDGIKYTMGDKVFEYRNARDIIFKNFKPTEEIGVKKPVEINGYFWKDMKITDDKGQINLSKEEQDFINEKADEN